MIFPWIVITDKIQSYVLTFISNHNCWGLSNTQTLPILLFCYSPDILNAYQAPDTVRGSKRFGQEPCSTVWPAKVWLTGQQLADLCHSNLVETKATFDNWKVQRISMQIRLSDGLNCVKYIRIFFLFSFFWLNPIRVSMS